MGDLFRGDVFHQPQGGDHLEFIRREKTILSRINVNTFQLATPDPSAFFYLPVVKRLTTNQPVALCWRTIIERNRHATPEDLSSSNPLPANQGCRLNLSDD